MPYRQLQTQHRCTSPVRAKPGSISHLLLLSAQHNPSVDTAETQSHTLYAAARCDVNMQQPQQLWRKKGQAVQTALGGGHARRMRKDARCCTLHADFNKQHPLQLWVQEAQCCACARLHKPQPAPMWLTSDSFCLCGEPCCHWKTRFMTLRKRAA